MRIRIVCLSIVFALFACFQATGQIVTTRISGRRVNVTLRPTSAPTTVATKPAPVDPAVMAILKRLEIADEKHPRLTANILHHVDMLQQADSETRTGEVYYQAGTKDSAAKFRIHFDTLRQGEGIKTKRVEDYVFDGAWLTVRKEKTKEMTRYQVAPPGTKVEPMELGKGPFPVPFGQEAESILKHFVATTRKPTAKDPVGTDYLKLVTRPAAVRNTNLVRVEMWVGRETGLPVKIVAEDKSENVTTVDFKDIETPKSFSKNTFDLPRPPRSWTYRVEPYRGNVKAPGTK